MKTVIVKQMLLSAILAITLNSCAQYGTNAINGNGNTTTISRSTAEYSGIKCAGSMDFILIKGQEGNITLEGESNLLPYIVTEVHGNNLVVKVKDGTNLRPSKNKGIIITIPFEAVSEIALTGSGDLRNTDMISEDNLEVSLTGSGDVVLDVSTSNLKAEITGSGDITLKGDTENLEVEVTGSGDFHGFDLQSKNTDASVTGSGDADVVSLNNLKGRVSGSGDITYKGQPQKEDTKVSGSGSISTH